MKTKRVISKVIGLHISAIQKNEEKMGGQLFLLFFFLTKRRPGFVSIPIWLFSFHLLLYITFWYTWENLMHMHVTYFNCFVDQIILYKTKCLHVKNFQISPLC